MLSAIQQLRENIERGRAVNGLYLALNQLATPVLDTTDLLRTQIVMAVSALDHYIHELTCLGMLEVFDGKRQSTDAFLRFQVTIEAAMTGLTGLSGNTWFETEIRKRHGHLTFQHPDRIADAVRRFSPCHLWPSVASQMGVTVQEVRGSLRLIVDRRNKIVHEADLDPSYPGLRWPISPADATDTVDFIQEVCEAIHLVVT